MSEPIEDWGEFDAVSLLALALFREDYRIRLKTDPTGKAFANGTEHGIYQERAERIFEFAPALLAAIKAGCPTDIRFEELAGAMAAGDREQIAEIEAEFHEAARR